MPRNISSSRISRLWASRKSTEKTSWARPPSCSDKYSLTLPGESNTGRAASSPATERRASSSTAATSARLALPPRPFTRLSSSGPARSRPLRPPKASSRFCASVSTEVPRIPVRSRRAISSASASAPGPWASSFSRGRAGAGMSLSIAGRRDRVEQRRLVKSNPQSIAGKTSPLESRRARVVPDPPLSIERPRRRRLRRHLRDAAGHPLAGHRRARAGDGSAPARPGRRLPRLVRAALRRGLRRAQPASCCSG